MTLGVMNRIRKAANIEKIVIERFMRSVADSLREGALILDVGAGSAPYRDLFVDRYHYLATDLALSWGDDRIGALDLISDAHSLPVTRDSIDASRKNRC